MPQLIEAIRHGRLKQIQLALRVGWNVNERDPENLRTPLIELSFIDQETTAVRLCRRFLEKGAKIKLRDKNGRNALLHACLKGRMKLVEIMLKEDERLNVNERDNHGNTALFLAVESGNIDVVRLLLKALKRYKLSSDVCNNHGETPLILASQTRKFLIREILISEGNASTEIRDEKRCLTAKEWEGVKVTRMTEGELPLSFPGNIKHCLFNARSGSRTLHISRLDQSCRRDSLKIEVENSSYKGELNYLFDIYREQLTTSYCPSVIPPKLKDDGDVSDMSVLSQYDDFYSICPLNPDYASETCPMGPPHTEKRLSISKPVQIPLSLKRMRRQSLASTEKAKLSQKSNLTTKQEHGPQMKSYRRGSINILQKLQVPIKKRHSSPLLRQHQRSSQNEKLDEMMLLLNKLDVLTEEGKLGLSKIYTIETLSFIEIVHEEKVTTELVIRQAIFIFRSYIHMHELVRKNWQFVTTLRAAARETIS